MRRRFVGSFLGTDMCQSGILKVLFDSGELFAYFCQPIALAEPRRR